MKLVIAEKPSVAHDIAAVIGADEKIESNVYKGNGYIVTSARGHLVRLKKPPEIDERYKKFDLSQLPIVPDFDSEFKPSENADELLKKLDKYMKSDEVDEIIEATDAGREGEVIFRYIYNFLGCTKPFKRLWISSMTEQSIRQGFADLQPSSKMDNAFAAGFARNKIDWLYGMNLSRLYTIYHGTVCRIGRVKTPVLNMIVQRDREIKSFVKKPFYKLKLDNGAEWFCDDADNFAEKSDAEAIKAKCENALCTVISADSKQKKENRPLLFSLTSLQAEANEKLGFTAAKTLTIAQSLYEKKLFTYPRTDSNFLTDDMIAILPARLEALRFFDEVSVNEIIEKGLNIDSRVINNAKVSDHHAIIPTENIANMSSLTSDEKAIAEMILTRFLAILSAQYEYSETEYIFDISGEKFRLKSKQTINSGWKKFYPEKSEKEEFSYTEGQTFEAKNLVITEGETQPPKHFTEATLLKAMENIDRRIDDKELAEYVSERGLGTPATRASIIEEIIANGVIRRDGKSLVAEQFGEKLIDILPETIKSVELTANMEQKLSLIEKGELSPDEVISSTIETINSIISDEGKREHVSFAAPVEKTSLGKCPYCGGNVYKFSRDGSPTSYYCENTPSKNKQIEKPCFFRLYEDDFFFSSKGKKLTESTLKALLQKGKIKVSGLKSKDKSKTYDAIISFSEKVYEDKNGNRKVGFSMEFDN